jgi:hypothetical protein
VGDGIVGVAVGDGVAAGDVGTGVGASDEVGAGVGEGDGVEEASTSGGSAVAVVGARSPAARANETIGTCRGRRSNGRTIEGWYDPAAGLPRTVPDGSA